MTSRCVEAVVLLALLVGIAAPAAADPSTFTYSYGNLAAKAIFNQDGNKLYITLLNMSVEDVTEPVQVLTGVFFDVTGVDSSLLTADAADVLGVVLHWPGDPPPPDEVGGEYGYRSDLTTPAKNVVACVGLGDILGGGDLFQPGINHWGPEAPNGLDFGLVGPGDDPTAGNQKVTGGGSGNPIPLIKNGVRLEMGLPTSDEIGISNVWFNYGTDLNAVPAPGAVALGLVGLSALGLYMRRHA